MITFKTLTWGNMFSYGPSNSIALDKSFVTQLVGFNGNGKSSIPLILEECLYNKNSKGTKRQDVLNRNSGMKSYWCSMEFEIDGVPYLIEAKRASTHSIKLLESGVDISGHTATQTYQKIDELLGLDFKTFSQIVYQNSSSSLQFLTATDTNRKKFLIDLLSLDRYVALFEQLKEHHKAVSDKLTSAKATYNAISSWIDQHGKEPLKILPTVEVAEYPSSLELVLNEQRTRLSDADRLNKKIQSNEQYKNLRSKIELPVKVDTPKDTKELITKIATANTERLAHQKVYDRVSKLDKSCPTCDQTISEGFKGTLMTNAKSMVDSLTQNIESLSLDLTKYESHNKVVSTNLKLMSEFEKYSSLIDSSLPNTLVDKEDLSDSITELSNRIKVIKEAITASEQLNQKAIANNSRVKMVSEQLEQYEQKLKDAQDTLSELNDDASYLEVLKKAFSTNGLLAYKIESSVKDLEALTNYYLTELSGGRFQISYTINNDKLPVIITDNGNDITIEALSAGELARVTTSTLLAIRKLMATLSKHQLNVLFLDETIDTLDADGKEKLIEVLLNEKDINVFLVSHGYSHPLLDKITVTKEMNISRLEE